MSFLSIHNLSVRLKKGPPLLRRVSLDVAAGEVRGLVGESGAGKSMIGKAVLGILPPSVEVTEGEILLDGVDLLKLPPAQRRKRIGAMAALAWVQYVMAGSDSELRPWLLAGKGTNGV